MIDAITTYKSVRQEILDQKKCQFNLFGVAITLTSAVLAYAAAATDVGPLVYVAPVLLNVLAMAIILDKAISIQRMVGYLQLVEQGDNGKEWMWEYHLSKFRELKGTWSGAESFRRHSYVLQVSMILLALNVLCASLYFYGPSAKLLRNSSEWSQVSEIYGAVNLVVLILLSVGAVLALRRWFQLVFGQYTGKAILARWLDAIK